MKDESTGNQKAEQEATFNNAKCSLVVTPKVKAEQVFIYRGFGDVPNLIKFVGARPIINEDTSIQIKRMFIPDDSVVFRSSFGTVTKVLTFDEAEALYDIKAQSEFKPEHAAVVVPKVSKTKK